MRDIVSEGRRALLRRRESIRRRFAQNAEEERQLFGGPEPDLLDRSSQAEAVGMLGRVEEAELRELQEIDAALQRIASGTYGRCVECGSSIGRQRLRALPEARHCLSCLSPMRSSA